MQRVWCNARVEQVGYYFRHFGMVEVSGSSFQKGGRDYICRCRSMASPSIQEASSRPLQLLVFGDSVACGVRCTSNDAALAGACARCLATRSQRAVNWDILAKSGLDARGMQETLIPILQQQSKSMMLAWYQSASTICFRHIFHQHLLLIFTIYYRYLVRS